MEKIETKDLSAPMELKVLDDERGIVEAWVSVTGVEDEVKDVIEPGAYAKTLAKRKPKMVWGHDWNKPIGKTLEIEEVMPGDPRLPAAIRAQGGGGLRVKAQLILGTQLGRDAYEVLKAFDDEAEFSIGYQVPPGGAVVESKSGVRRIRTLDCYEYSPVLFGAMPLARGAQVKSLAPVIERLEGKASAPPPARVEEIEGLFCVIDPSDDEDAEPECYDTREEAVARLRGRANAVPPASTEEKAAPKRDKAWAPCPKCGSEKVELKDGKGYCANDGTKLALKFGSTARGEKARDLELEYAIAIGQPVQLKTAGYDATAGLTAEELAEGEDFDGELTEDEALEVLDAIEAAGVGVTAEEMKTLRELAGLVETKAVGEGAASVGKGAGGAERLRQYWLKGEGAAKIRWGTDGDWTRCYRNLSKYMGPRAKGYCNLLHKRATGMYAGDRGNKTLEGKAGDEPYRRPSAQRERRQAAKDPAFEELHPRAADGKFTNSGAGGSNSMGRGAGGGQVRTLQAKLNELGYNLAEDGKLGPKTEAAIRDYQRKNGLKVDGLAGIETLGAMGDDAGSSGDAPRKRAARKRPSAANRRQRERERSHEHGAAAKPKPKPKPRGRRRASATPPGDMRVKALHAANALADVSLGLELKEGRTLSSANAQRVARAVEELIAVLRSAGIEVDE